MAKLTAPQLAAQAADAARWRQLIAVLTDDTRNGQLIAIDANLALRVTNDTNRGLAIIRAIQLQPEQAT